MKRISKLPHGPPETTAFTYREAILPLEKVLSLSTHLCWFRRRFSLLALILEITLYKAMRLL